MKIALLPGDGIGPEIVREAARVLDVLRRDGLAIETESAPIGGAGHDAAGHPLPAATLKLALAPAGTERLCGGGVMVIGPDAKPAAIE